MCRSIRAPALTLYLHIYNTLNRQRKKKRKVEINDTLLLTPYSYGNSNNINRKEDIVSKRHYLNSCLVSIEEFDLWWIHICFYLWLTFHLDGFLLRFTSVSTSVASTRSILGSYWLIAIYNNNMTENTARPIAVLHKSRISFLGRTQRIELVLTLTLSHWLVWMVCHVHRCGCWLLMCRLQV